MANLAKYQPQWVPISTIDTENTEFQFRKELNIEPLAKSLQEDGQKFPIVVWIRNDEWDMQLISGFRRLNAAKSLKWEKILAIVIPEKDMKRDEALRLNFIENIERKTLTNMDLIFACKKLRDNGKLQAEIALLIGKSEASVRRYLSITGTDNATQEKVRSGEVSIRSFNTKEQTATRGGSTEISENSYVKSIKNGFDANIRFRLGRDSAETLKVFINNCSTAYKEALKSMRKAERAKRAKKGKKAKGRRIDSSAAALLQNDHKNGAILSGTKDPGGSVPQGLKHLVISGPQKVRSGETITLKAEGYGEGASRVSGVVPQWRSKTPELAVLKIENGAEADTHRAECISVVGKAPGICYIKAILGTLEATHMFEVVGQ